MKLERTKNTKRNILIGEIDKVTGIILPFIVRTMIIHIMGAEYLGLTSLYYSIIQMLNLAEMGFGTAIIYSLYKPIADEDTPKINALLKFYKKVYSISGLIVLISGLFIMLFLRHFIKGEPPTDLNIYFLYLIYLLNACIGFFVYPNMKALIIAHQRDSLSGFIHIFTQLGMYIAQAVFIYFSRDYYLYAAMMPLSSLIYSILCGKIAEKKYPDYRPDGSIDEETYKKIKTQVIGVFIRKTATLSRNALDSIFISSYLGLGITAIYNNYYYILDSVVLIIAVIKTSMAGGVGNSIATETKDKNFNDMKKIDFLFMTIGGCCTAMMLCLYQPFMKLWVGDSMTLPVYYAFLFSLYFYILKMSDIRTLYAEAIGVWWEARYISVAEAFTNLALNWILIKHFGLVGIIIATLISYFIFNFIGGGIVLFKKYFDKEKYIRYIRYHLIYFISAVVISLIAYLITSSINLNSFLDFIIKGILCLSIAIILYFVIYNRTDVYREGIQLVLKKGNKNEKN